MIKAKCICGAEIQLPQSFIGESLPCESCQKPVTLVARESSMDRPAIRLTVHQGPTRLNEQFLVGGNGPIEIGKLNGKHIQLPGEQISRTHCLLMKTEMGWLIQDNASKNGLYINNQRVNAHVLNDGDIIGAGEFQLIFNRIVGDVAPDPPAAEPELNFRDEPEDVDNLEILPDDAPLDVDENRAVFEAALRTARTPPPVAITDDGTFELAAPVAPPPVAKKAPPIAKAVPMDGPMCPSCAKRLPRGGIICVNCGIDVHTGRSLITAKGFDEDEFAEKAKTWIDIFSLLIPLTIIPIPIASEAFGTRKPKVIFATAIITFVISLIFAIAINASGGWDACKNLMLWCGNPSKSRIEEILIDQDKRIEKYEARTGRHLDSSELAERRARLREELEQNEELAHPGEFHWYQVLTNAFLHDFSGPYSFFEHFGGNCLFLIVFGGAVNSAIGNRKTAIIYLFLAVAASSTEIIAYATRAPSPCLGASGAIMGLAGMYLVLFPVHRLHVTVWFRMFYLTRCFFHVWAVRGFWFVLFCILLNDVLPTIRGTQDHVGHWAHLGGFITGVAIAMFMLLTRTVDARGGDILTAMFGRKAWALVGKPAEHAIST